MNRYSQNPLFGNKLTEIIISIFLVLFYLTACCVYFLNRIYSGVVLASLEFQSLRYLPFCTHRLPL